jgi:hypothetical protein
MVLSAVLGATHSTAPWYFAVPVVVLLIAARLWRARRRGGPFRRGPFGGSGDGE